jgi:biopolymer transport protein ExbB
MKFLSIFLFQNVAETETETQSLMDLILMGGPLTIIIVGVLLILSFIALFIFFTKYFDIRRAGSVDKSFMTNIKSAVQAGNLDGARKLCANYNTPTARMLEKGLMRIGKPLREIDAAIENVGNLELFKLESKLSTLASIAGAAPMIGFFGTVTGMILAFYKMATEQNVTPDVLAGGIYQALITTAFGLFIGIFAFIAYNYLVSKVEGVVFKMEQSTVEFMDLLQDPS